MVGLNKFDDKDRRRMRRKYQERDKFKRKEGRPRQFEDVPYMEWDDDEA